MKTHKFDGVTIWVRRKDSALKCRFDDIVEVVEDHEGGSGEKSLLLKKSNGAAIVTSATFKSEEVDRWCRESDGA